MDFPVSAKSRRRVRRDQEEAVEAAGVVEAAGERRRDPSEGRDQEGRE